MPRPLLLWGVLGLLLVSLILGAVLLPLRDYRESRYAEAGREILESGDWLVPKLNGSPYLNKPPLLPWLVALSMKGFGEVEWAARLPSLFAVVVCALLVSGLSRDLVGGRSRGILGGLIFLGLPATQYYGRMLMSDTLATAAMTLALWAFLRGLKDDRGRGWFALGFLACAVGVMARGLIGLFYPVGALVIYLLIWDRRSMGQVPWVLGGLIFAAVTIPWFLALEIRNPGFLQHHIVEQQLFRVFSGHGQPFVAVSRGEILLSFMGLLGPAVFLLPGAWKGGGSDRAGQRLLWLYSGGVLVTVLLSSGRNHPYTLPAMAPLAAVVGAWAVSDARGGRARMGGILFLLASASILFALPRLGTILSGISSLLEHPAVFRTAWVCLLGVAALLAASGLTLLRGRNDWACLGLAAVMIPGSVMITTMESYLAPQISRGSLALQVRKMVPAECPLFVADPADRQFEGTGGWGFYAHRKVLMVSFEDLDGRSLQGVQRPPWIVPLSFLMERLRNGTPLALLATKAAVERIPWSAWPAPVARDAEFGLWLFHRPGGVSLQQSIQAGRISSSRTLSQGQAWDSADLLALSPMAFIP
jgi:4-amino-4-deoxy-L-arabinose transferase-like glycosyltransferase